MPIYLRNALSVLNSLGSGGSNIANALVGAPATINHQSANANTAAH